MLGITFPMLCSIFFSHKVSQIFCPFINDIHYVEYFSFCCCLLKHLFELLKDKRKKLWKIRIGKLSFKGNFSHLWLNQIAAWKPFQKKVSCETLVTSAVLSKVKDVSIIGQGQYLKRIRWVSFIREMRKSWVWARYFIFLNLMLCARHLLFHWQSCC